MFANLCIIYLRQSVGSFLQLEPAQAKMSELAWLGSVTNLNPSQAWLGLESKLDIRAQLSSVLKGGGIPS